MPARCGAQQETLAVLRLTQIVVERTSETNVADGSEAIHGRTYWFRAAQPRTLCRDFMAHFLTSKLGGMCGFPQAVVHF